MDISELSKEERTELLKQLEEEKKAEKKKREENKETLKELQHEFVEKYFPNLLRIEVEMSADKKTIFDGAAAIISLKKDVYGLTDEALSKQQSHTISNDDCSKTIIIGHNTVDGWDADLAASGIDKVNKWLEKQLKSNSKDLVDMIRDLLRPNKDGLLKANRVIELANRAGKIGDSELIEAVSEIQQAYQPKKTTTFVKAKYRNNAGQDVWLNLSMSNV
ncbi:MAG: DUF3164 family protein [Bacteroidales bacterium]|jgi:hypothetical protein|nr:DUF3164 family protein [Bacteroidales bacterium]